MHYIENAFDRTTSNQRRWGAFSFEGLLEDPAIGSWAREVAAERQVTPLDALALLAQALVLDARR
jgi:hypothetical protein